MNLTVLGTMRFPLVQRFFLVELPDVRRLPLVCPPRATVDQHPGKPVAHVLVRVEVPFGDVDRGTGSYPPCLHLPRSPEKVTEEETENVGASLVPLTERFKLSTFFCPHPIYTSALLIFTLFLGLLPLLLLPL